MEVFNSNVIERRQAVRNDSFSTIASSAAAEMLQDAQFTQDSTNPSDASRYIASLRDQNGRSKNQTNMRFDSSEGVHVGDIIHIYHQNPVGSQTSSTSVDKSPSIKSSVSDNFVKTKKNFRGENRRRIVLITAIVISLVTFVSIAVPVVYFVVIKNPTDVETTTTTTQPPSVIIIKRAEWDASPPKAGIRKLALPIKRIIVAHTADISCNNQDDCKAVVKSIQTDNSHLDDIPYNFLIGGDGNVYEGRGLEYEGQHTSNVDATEYNSIGICIAFIGNFQTRAPSDIQLGAFNDFIAYYVSLEKIDEDYIIVTQDDLMYKSEKANALNQAISNMENFYPLQKVYRREEWGASRRSGTMTKFNQTLNWVMLSHTVSGACSTVEVCAQSCRTIQRAHMNKTQFNDFAFNFAIGGDGFVFEARGWDSMGAHFSGYNDRTIGIVAIGTFDHIEPSQGMLDSLERMLFDAEALGKLRSNFKVNGREDFGYPGPGEAFMQHLRQWCNYGNRTEPCTS